MRILVVEDDVKLTRALSRGLTVEGYQVDVADTGDRGLSLATAEDYDAVLLDLMLPGMDGFAVCAELRRRQRNCPVLMLTARAEVSDRIRGLDGGADDYLVKPFAFGELLARLRVLVRRKHVAHQNLLEIGTLRVDPATRMVTRAGRQIELTAREFEVLKVLAENPGRLLTRTEILDAVWEEDFAGSPNIVDVYIGYLRKKLERPKSRRMIRTIRGKGFVLETS